MSSEYERDIKRFGPLAILLVFVIISFFLLKPLLIAILTGLLLAFVFNPVYQWIKPRVINDTIAAVLTLLLAVLILLIPLWFVVPIIVVQIFEIFKNFQTINIGGYITSLFPKAPDQFLNQVSAATGSFITKVASIVLNSLADLLLNAAALLLNIFIGGFVFFYALRDSESLKKMSREILNEISPIIRSKEKILIKQFKDITHALIYGQVIIGIVQGILAGFGLYIFGVPNAIALTLAAIILSIIPLIGPSPVWIGVTIFLFTTTTPPIAIAYLLYNLLIVSTVDNFLRTYIVSRKTHLSPVIVLIGMIGGLFLFGIIGLILGPLILAYLITFWQTYKEISPSR